MTTLRVLVDSREQMPFSFSRFNDVAVERGTLGTVDYSIPGLHEGGPASIAIERKSLDDLVGSIQGNNRDRFSRELQRAASLYETFYVVCEGSWQDISSHSYKSDMKPQSVLQTIFTFMARYKVPFIMAGSREAAEYIVHGLLSKHIYEIEKRFNQVVRGRGVTCCGRNHMKIMCTTGK